MTLKQLIICSSFALLIPETEMCCCHFSALKYNMQCVEFCKLFYGVQA